MKRSRFPALVLVAVCISGCTTTFRPWSLSQIHEGMPREAVVAILGEPDYLEQKDGTVLLHYTYQEALHPFGSSMNPVVMDPAAARTGFVDPINTRIYHYIVIMVDGMVQSYKEIQEPSSDISP